MIHALNRFVYRIPALPIEELVAPAAYGDIDEYLKSFFNRANFMEAMYMASPEFTAEIPLFMEGKITEAKRLSRFRSTALKYIGRMASRPTPFGLFSGCGVGYFEDDNNLRPTEGATLSPRIRLDMGLLTSYSEYILSRKELRKALKFYSNNTIYRFGSKFRYVEFVFKDGEKLYNLASFEASEYIDKLLAVAKNGALFSDFYDLLVDEDVTEDDVDDFVFDLIDSKILLSELEPLMTGIEYDEQIFRQTIEILERKLEPTARSFFEKSFKVFSETRDMFAAIAADGIGIGPERYEAIIQVLKQLDLNFPVKHYLQLDSFVTQADRPTLDRAILKDIMDGVSVVTKFCSHSSNGSLAEFKKKFRERFEGQKVKLVEVIDPEAGIGYGNVNNEMLDITPFVDEMPIGTNPPSDRKSFSWHTELHGLLLRKSLEAKQQGVQRVQLTKKDLEPLKSKISLLPPTFNAFVSVSFDENGQHQIYFHQVGATSASCLLGRFGFLNNEMHDLIADIHQEESNYFPGKIVAEINHLSESRVGNVMLRPKTRSHEICYVTKSNIVEEGKIELDDLYIHLDNGKIILSSGKLNKEIVPRLSNAHNYYKDTLPVYKFLSDLQEEDTDGYLGLVTDIGQVPDLVDFVPRLEHKNIVIWPAHWYINTDEIRKYFELPDESFHQSLKQYLQTKGLPTWFYLTNREFDLFVDMENIHSLKIFVEEIKNMPKFTLKESLSQKGTQNLITNATGNFLHELIVPLAKDAPKTNETSKSAETPTPALAPEPASLVKRKFYPGEEWVYFKVYAGIKVSEQIVSESLAPLIDFLKENGMIDSWFFLRFTDPSFHLRIRLHLTDAKHFGPVVENFNIYFRDYLAAGTIKTILLDTYERELERYAFNLIEQAERIFSLDSELSVQLLEEVSSRKIGSHKWLLALGVIDTYLEVFQLSDEERLRFTKGIRDVFAIEFNANKMQRRYFSAKYRNSQSLIDQFIAEKIWEGQDLDWYHRIINNFKFQIQPIYDQYYKQLDTYTREQQLNSFIHMSVDRFFSSKNRLHEYALYSLLEQFYRYKVGKTTHVKNEETV